MAIPFLAQHISGLAEPTYPSAATNKDYVDRISGALATEIAALGDTPENWTSLTAGDGVAAFEGSIGVSGSTPVTVNVEGYSTISSAAHQAYASSQILGDMAFKDSVDIGDDTNLTAGTGLELDGDTLNIEGYSTISSAAHQAYASSQILGDLAFKDQATQADLASGAAYQYVREWMIASGEAYSKAVASANALKTVQEGYAAIADNGTIAHNLGGQPSSYYVLPSGDVTFAVAATADATNITVRMSAGGTRGVHWRAEL